MSSAQSGSITSCTFSMEDGRKLPIAEGPSCGTSMAGTCSSIQKSSPVIEGSERSAGGFESSVEVNSAGNNESFTEEGPGLPALSSRNLSSSSSSIAGKFGSDTHLVTVTFGHNGACYQ